MRSNNNPISKWTGLTQQPKVCLPGPRKLASNSWERYVATWTASSLYKLLTPSQIARFHDETPEVVSLYVGSSESENLQWAHTIEPSPPPEEQRVPDASHATQPQEQHTQNTPLSQPPHDPTDVSPSSVSFYSTTSPRSRSSSKPFQPFTVRESILVRNFVENMALWVCSCHRTNW